MDTDTKPWFKAPMRDVVDDPDYRPLSRYRPYLEFNQANY